MKNIRIHKFLIAKNLICLWLTCGLISCSEEKHRWQGIWRTEIEQTPGLNSVLELELRREIFSHEWNGSWRNIESMSTGDMKKVVVSDSTIEMVLITNSKFKGAISNKRGTLEGVLFENDEPIDTLSFTKVNDWTNIPARLAEGGQVVEQWNYQVPKPINDGWPVATLTDAGIAQQPLEELFQSVIEGKYYGLDAALVAHKGRLVLEEYFYLGKRDRIHTVQSVTKSVTSLLFGIASDKGSIGNLERPIHDFFPAYTDSSKMNNWSASLKHTLMMSAALDWNEQDIPYTDPDNDAVRMNNSNDMYHYVLSKKRTPGEEPGQKFYYNSGLSILLGGVLQNATGMTADQYAEKTLFRKLGIDEYHWATLKDKIHTGGGLFLTARDLLKIGQLVVDKGRWNGEQIISESWIEESTAFHLKIGDSQGNFGYGYQWWQNEFSVGDKRYRTIYASGYGGQMLWIVPELDLVVVVLHHNPDDYEANHSINWKEMEEIIIPAVL